MGILETLLIAIGGPAVVIAGVAWFAKSLISQWLNKELKHHESDLSRNAKQFELELKGKYDTAAERLKSDLQRQATENQIRFSKLHEKTAEVTAEAYRLLVTALWEIETAVSPLKLGENPDLIGQFNSAFDSLLEFYRYFGVHRIYLPEDVCKSVESIFSETRSTLIMYGTYLRYDPQSLPVHAQTKKIEIESKAWDKIKNEIPTAREKLETQFRNLLGHKPQTTTAT
ncbi:hypothetical protein U875_14060 [Pandoraea pnomenusa 3kgm]|uniref:hypothetical protein n=1 Tax=Pandoraea pnomenusa TaxID=93220 RepID=UPI0003C76A39|nr:hypothetical protein [Pandoraea pnomenusa]AHB08503.1 hypothetical protein U875_14060 [Pandoraea pnomenusa 3kgm]